MSCPLYWRCGSYAILSCAEHCNKPVWDSKYGTPQTVVDALIYAHWSYHIKGQPKMMQLKSNAWYDKRILSEYLNGEILIIIKSYDTNSDSFRFTTELLTSLQHEMKVYKDGHIVAFMIMDACGIALSLNHNVSTFEPIASI